MDKNYNTNMDCKRMMAEFTEAFGDAAKRGVYGDTAGFCDDALGVLKIEVLIHIQNPPCNQAVSSSLVVMMR